MNLIDFFDRTAGRHPERAAYVFEGRTWPYREVADLATRIGHGLKTLGVEGETKCAVISRNHPLAFTAMLGILKARGTWVPIHTANGEEENLYLVDFFDVEVLFYEREFEAFACRVKESNPRVRSFICVDGDGDLGRSLDTWAAGQATDTIHLPWEPDAMCFLRGTGGTTGRPKGVMNVNRNFETTIANYAAMLLFDAPPVYLACAPLSHAATVFAFINIALGGTMVIHRRFDVLQTCAAIEEHRISFAYLPPTAIYKVLSHPRVRDFDYSSLRHFLYGAAPTAASKLGEAIDVFGHVMTQGYGQTEVPTSVTYLAPEEHLGADGEIDEKRLLSCGRPTPFAGVALMDEDGNFVPVGNIGEIVVRGGLVMKGYYKNPKATDEVSKHGWHHTGDLAYADEDGFIYICDRKNEIIITGGFNVYPLEVEQVVLSHPAVQDCAVVGVPDDTWGEVIKAVVELKPDRTVAAEDLIRLCKGRIGSVKAPKSVDFVGDLPRSPVGKVARRDVRDRYWKGQEKKV